MGCKVNVIILAGGRGTRLQPLTFAIPKPLIPVGEKPILELLLQHLLHFEFRKVFLAVGYRAELIETYFGDGKRFGMELCYQREKTPLGTAGPVRLIRDAYKLYGPCLVLNADIMTDIDFAHLIKCHREKQADMTVTYMKYEHKVRFGTLDIKEGRIEGAKEKPSLSFYISTGIYLLEQSAIDVIPVHKLYDMPDLMNQLVYKQMRVAAYPLTAKWRAIETIEDLEDAHNHSKNNNLLLRKGKG